MEEEDKFYDAIYALGRDVIVSARDKAIQECSKILNGTTEDSDNLELSRKIGGLEFTEDQQKVLKAIIMAAIDRSLNYFLWILNDQQGIPGFTFHSVCDDGEEFDKDPFVDLSVEYWGIVDEYSEYCYKNTDETQTLDELIEGI